MAYIIFDTETTGLSPHMGDRIIEIAAVRVVNGEITDSFEALINPHRPLSPEAARVNRITEEMVRDAPDASVVIPQFLEFVGSDTLVAHNAEFDMGFLKAEMERLGRNFFQYVPAICTVDLAREELPQLERHNLGALIEHFGINADRRHRAIDDVKATAEVFIRLHKEEPTLF
jgi:DNA polymerase-3 subunit alpha (Gram-positive type)